MIREAVADTLREEQPWMSEMEIQAAVRHVVYVNESDHVRVAVRLPQREVMLDISTRRAEAA